MYHSCAVSCVVFGAVSPLSFPRPGSPYAPLHGRQPMKVFVMLGGRLGLMCWAFIAVPGSRKSVGLDFLTPMIPFRVLEGERGLVYFEKFYMRCSIVYSSSQKTT